MAMPSMIEDVGEERGNADDEKSLRRKKGEKATRDGRLAQGRTLSNVQRGEALSSLPVKVTQRQRPASALCCVRCAALRACRALHSTCALWPHGYSACSGCGGIIFGARRRGREEENSG